MKPVFCTRTEIWPIYPLDCVWVWKREGNAKRARERLRWRDARLQEVQAKPSDLSEARGLIWWQGIRWRRRSTGQVVRAGGKSVSEKSARERRCMKYGAMVTHSSGSKALMYSVLSGSDTVGVWGSLLALACVEQRLKQLYLSDVHHHHLGNRPKSPPQPPTQTLYS